MTRAENVSLGFFRITYKTAAEQLAKEREKRLASANKKKAKVHKKKSAPASARHPCAIQQAAASRCGNWAERCPSTGW